MKKCREEQKTLTLEDAFWEKNSNSSFLVEDQSSVIIYGAGNVGQYVYRFLRNRGIPVHCFLDRKAQPGDQLHGVPILPPVEYSISRHDRESLRVIVAVFNRDSEILQIIETLERAGYSRIITYVDFHHCFCEDLEDNYWLTARARYKEFHSAICEGASLWADESSRQLYWNILEFRLSGDYSVLPQPDLKNQYFPLGVPEWVTPMRFVDCGAFDGDTVAAIFARIKDVEAVAAFEPDEQNFPKLVSRVQEFLSSDTEFYSWPSGVYSSTRQLSFSSQGEASHLDSSNKAAKMVQCVSLDEVIPRFRPTLIKLDIEGAELEALHGAKHLITRSLPGLAVCVYHCAEHLWEIPLLLD